MSKKEDKIVNALLEDVIRGQFPEEMTKNTPEIILPNGHSMSIYEDSLWIRSKWKHIGIHIYRLNKKQGERARIAIRAMKERRLQRDRIDFIDFLEAS